MDKDKLLSLLFSDALNMDDSVHIVHKSGKKDEKGKPVKETELYIDNKAPGMQAKYDRLRINGTTKVFQSVWKWMNGKLKIVHSHWKS